MNHPPAITYELAVKIADRVARSDIELFCRDIAQGKGRPVFDVSCSPFDFDGWEDGRLSTIADVVRYVELRGDALPYRMHHLDDLVWFEEASHDRGSTDTSQGEPATE
jgi:hypothetical protein